MNYRQPARKALAQYGKVGVQSIADTATPHRLVQMLMEGALSRIAAAKGHTMRREVAERGESIGLAISIIDTLRASLNAETGGEIAVNLDRLYEYMSRRLLETNLQNDESILDEVHGLMRQIKDGWDGIGGMPESAQPEAMTESSSSHVSEKG